MILNKKFDNTTAFVIFGVTGDLTRRKLIPALAEIIKNNKDQQKLLLIGFARRDWTSISMVNNLLDALPADYKDKFKQPLDRLFQNAIYISSNFHDVTGYNHLGKILSVNGINNVVFYLATPPENYQEIIINIGNAGLQKISPGYSRIVVEKPYGRDLTSAISLENEVHKVFSEYQIYRIDHYLGKETVQNILVFRFANGIFEPLWDRKYVDHVQITVSETEGVGTRSGYYETSGVIRDMFQNHLLQLLSLMAMEAPIGFNADFVRDEKVKVLHALRPMNGKNVMINTYRAQYGAGILNGVRVPAYKDEIGVNPKSVTETFLAARLHIDNWRWSGVPFYMRSGKRLAARATQIVIQFRQAPLSLFNWQNTAGDAPNSLILDLQPNEGIMLTFGAKSPGQINHISPVKMSFSYEDTFGNKPPDAYQRLLLDCLVGDATLFTRSDEVLAQWEFTENILKGWNTQAISKLTGYLSGSWGPKGAEDFIHNDHRRWRIPD